MENLTPTTVKTPKKRSWSWQYFSVSENKVSCVICNESLVYHHSTSSMIYHLASKHRIYNCPLKRKRFEDEMESDDSEPEETSPSVTTNENNDPKDSKKDAKITNKILRFLIGTDQPLSLIKHNLFIEMVKELRKDFKVPSLKQVETKILPSMVCFK